MPAPFSRSIPFCFIGLDTLSETSELRIEFVFDREPPPYGRQVVHAYPPRTNGKLELFHELLKVNSTVQVTGTL